MHRGRGAAAVQGCRSFKICDDRFPLRGPLFGTRRWKMLGKYKDWLLSKDPSLQSRCAHARKDVFLNAVLWEFRTWTNIQLLASQQTWQTIRYLPYKRSHSNWSIKDRNGVLLSRTSCKDGENILKVFLTVKTLKAGKAAEDDEIRPEILKALNKGVLWLTRMCQLHCEIGKLGWSSPYTPHKRSLF